MAIIGNRRKRGGGDTLLAYLKDAGKLLGNGETLFKPRGKKIATFSYSLQMFLGAIPRQSAF